MISNNIVFADLSTYTPKETISFYESVFGWKYFEDNDYYIAYKENKEVVGLYETPEKFKQMRMPHFWMTYIQVNDVNETIKKAKELGGIIEMTSEENAIGSLALIRDPQGAGFTVYEGDKIRSTRTKKEINTLIWNELHISNVKRIIPFYEGVFNWSFIEGRKNNFEIYNDKNVYIADALEVSNEYKGKYEYWICTFAIKDLQNTREKIINKGGRLISNEGTKMMFVDNSGQAFFYVTALEEY